LLGRNVFRRAALFGVTLAIVQLFWAVRSAADELRIEGRLQNRMGYHLDGDHDHSLLDNLAQIELQKSFGTWDVKAVGRARSES